jgi:selenide,water dikinase
LKKLPKITSPDLLVGMETMDDAGVFRITKDIALVQTVDFFYPVVNDARTFGRIVAANSLSDVWAMGAKAITAMNILAYPAGKIPPETIGELLTGGNEKLKESDVVLVGGHTMEQEEFVYGMSITGVIHPDSIFTNSHARVGDMLILTKPIGTGVFSNASSEDGLTREQYKVFVTHMERLNKYASEILHQFDVSAMTDITGFGLLGHSLPIAQNAGVTLVFHSESIPLYPGIMELMDTYNPKGICKCQEFVEDSTWTDKNVNAGKIELFSEAQTSGGLLASVRTDQAEDVLNALHGGGDKAAAIIGEVTPGPGRDEKNPIYLRIIF